APGLRPGCSPVAPIAARPATVRPRACRTWASGSRPVVAPDNDDKSTGRLQGSDAGTALPSALSWGNWLQPFFRGHTITCGVTAEVPGSVHLSTCWSLPPSSAFLVDGNPALPSPVARPFLLDTHPGGSMPSLRLRFSRFRFAWCLVALALGLP